MFKTIGSFFGKVGSIFKNLFAKEPTVAQKVNTVVKLTAPIISAVIAKCAGEEGAAAVDAVIKEVETDLATVTGTIQAMGLSGTGKATVQTSLESVKDQLGGLLTAGHIKNEGTMKEVTQDVNFAVDEISAVLDVVGQYKTAAASAGAGQ